MKKGIKLTEYTIVTHKSIVPISIAIIADLHGQAYESVLRCLSIRNPDVIAIVGDVIEGDDEAYPIHFFSKCMSIAPTFFSMGNHERKITYNDIYSISATGTIVLDNTWLRYKDGIIIGGMTSPFVSEWRETRQIKLHYALPNHTWLDKFEKQTGFKILLDHHPENFSRLTRNRDIDLILSGHAHGGQIRVFGHGLYAPHQGFFPKYTSGVYENRLVVSRGLSNLKLIPRICNSEEIVIVNITNQVGHNSQKENS